MEPNRISKEYILVKRLTFVHNEFGILFSGLHFTFYRQNSEVISDARTRKNEHHFHFHDYQEQVSSGNTSQTAVVIYNDDIILSIFFLATEFFIRSLRQGHQPVMPTSLSQTPPYGCHTPIRDGFFAFFQVISLLAHSPKKVSSNVSNFMQDKSHLDSVSYTLTTWSLENGERDWLVLEQGCKKIFECLGIFTAS